MRCKIKLCFAELEYVSIEKRSFVGNLSLAISLTVGGVYQPWLLKLVGDWKLFLFLLYIQCAIVFAAPWYVGIDSTKE
jgi:hypothetical protein